MANEFIARNGLIAQNNSTITGSLTVTQGITGSLFGTSSWSTNAVSASNVTVTNDTSTNATHYIVFSPSTTGSAKVTIDSSGLTYNPSTNLLTAGDLTLASGGSRTLTVQAQGAGGTEIKLLPNSTGGHARINVGNTTQPLDFQMNSVDVMRIAQDGKVGIGTTGATAKLEVRGTGINSSTTAFLIENATLSDLFKVLDDGTVIAGFNTALTVSSSGTTFVNASGNALDVTSAQATALTVAGGSNGSNIATFKSDDTNETLAYITTNGSIFTTASITATQGITGSLFGTSSWSNNATTASFVNPLNQNVTITGSIYLRSGSVIDSTGADIFIKAGVGNNAGIALYNNSLTQYLAVDDTGSYANKFTVADRLTVQGSITGSLFGTASFATTSSYALNGGVTQIVAGTNVTISPTNGLGAVTINSTGGGGGGGTDLGLVQAMVVGLQNIF